MAKLQRRVALAVVLAFVVAGIAMAYPPFVKVFKDTYKPGATTALGKAACATCHKSASDTKNFNPYGEDVRKAMKAAHLTKVTKDVLVKVEKLDSDKDGKSNIKEIKAGKLPGDPKSK